MSSAEQPETTLVPDTGDRPGQSDGGVLGYRARRTLPVGVELARQLRRRRSWLTLVLLAVLPVLLLLAFQTGQDSPAGSRNLADMATTSGLNFTVFTEYAATSFLLAVVVALFFGDTVASEASWSSLKYLLAAPVPRAHLLRQKAFVAGILSVAALVLLPAVAVSVGLIWFGPGDLLTPTGATLPFVTGLVRVGVALVYLAVHLTWIAGLALWLSVSTDAPLGAVGGAVLVSILSQILDQVHSLGQWRAYLPTHFSTAWADLLTPQVNWADMTRGAVSGLGYATVFVVLAVWRFHRKDITS